MDKETVDWIKELKRQIDELKRELKHHISNCPFREIK